MLESSYVLGNIIHVEPTALFVPHLLYYTEEFGELDPWKGVETGHISVR